MQHESGTLLTPTGRRPTARLPDITVGGWGGWQGGWTGGQGVGAMPAAPARNHSGAQRAPASHPEGEGAAILASHLASSTPGRTCSRRVSGCSAGGRLGRRSVGIRSAEPTVVVVLQPGLPHYA